MIPRGHNGGNLRLENLRDDVTPRLDHVNEADFDPRFGWVLGEDLLELPVSQC